MAAILAVPVYPVKCKTPSAANTKKLTALPYSANIYTLETQ